MSRRLEEDMERFFEEKGLTEAIRKFSETAECKAIINEAFDRLLANYEEMKQGAPDVYAEIIQRQIDRYNENSGREVFMDDVIQSFKMNFYAATMFSINAVNGVFTSERLLDSLKMDNYVNARKDVQMICDAMIEIIPQEFFKSTLVSLIPELLESGELSVGVYNRKTHQIEFISLDELLGEEEDDDDDDGDDDFSEIFGKESGLTS